MAKNTDINLRNMVLYSVYVRNYSPEGTFRAVEADLQRIRSLGVDIIWLLPIHPIGKINRKGDLGSPYAIQDYRKINPEYGSMEDFVSLVKAIHNLGMKCIIDVVYNHTSPDSWLAKNHPEWFYKKTDGNFGNKIGDWSDIIDLDYSQHALWDYQIETLKMWAKLADGFRCDVAPLVPLDFWLRAREEVASIRQDCLWISESVEPAFIAYNRSMGFTGLSDSEIYQAFDVAYDYDIYPWFDGFFEKKNSLSVYTEKMNAQETTYPDNYVKLRFLENHDRSRAHFLIPDEKNLRNWTAFLYFQKGMTMIYAGQEMGDKNKPNLFDKDIVNMQSGCNLTELMKTLYKIKKDTFFTNSRFYAEVLPGDVVIAAHKLQDRIIYGIFSLCANSSAVSVNVPDGRYTNLIDGTLFSIKNQIFNCSEIPVIFESSIK